MKAVQYFSDEYLEYCKTLSPEDILDFLEDFREIQQKKMDVSGKSQLISMKVNDKLLAAFKMRAKMEGIRYQTLIKQIMLDYLTQ